MTAVSAENERVIDSVLLLLPHGGVVDAAVNARNGMPRSENLNTVEPYSLVASVPYPYIEVLCVTMNKAEVEPLVFESWNDEIVNPITWPSRLLMAKATTTNKTVVHDVFGW